MEKEYENRIADFKKEIENRLTFALNDVRKPVFQREGEKTPELNGNYRVYHLKSDVKAEKG